MKININLIFGLLIMMFISTPLFAQKIIPVTFNSQGQHKINLNSVKKLKEGEFYQIKVQGINLNLYNVEINSNDTTFSSGLNFPSFGSLALTELSSMIEGINIGGLTAVIPNIDKAENNNTLPTGLLDIISQLKEIEGEMGNTKQIIIGLENKLIRIDGSIDDWKLEIYKSSLESLRLNSKKDSVYNFDKALIKAEKIRDSLGVLSEKTTQLIGKLTTISKKRLKILLEAKKIPVIPTAIKKAIDETKKIEAEIQKAIQKLGGETKKANEIMSATNVNKMLRPLIFQENNQSTVYWALPMQMTGEKVSLNLKLTPKNADISMPSYSTHFEFPAKSSNYQGVGASLYLSGLSDQAYSILAVQDPSPDDSLDYQIVDENPRKIEMGTAALLRIGKKNKDGNMGGHFSVGVGTSIGPKLRPRFLLGGGFSIGEKHMLTIDFGGIIGYVERRSQLFKDLSEVFEEKPERITVSELNTHVFASVGYVFRL